MLTIRSLAAGSLAGLFLLGSLSPAFAAPKSGPGGESCIETGTERRDGKDQDGNKVNCLWDFCKYCDQSGGTINCSVQKTSYSNARDCKAAMARPGSGTMAPGGGSVFDPGTSSPPKGRAPMQRPGGTMQKMQ